MALPPKPDGTPHSATQPDTAVWQKVVSIFAAVAGAVLATVALPLECLKPA